MAERNGLDQHIARRGRLGRAGQHGNLQGVGGELIQQPVAAAAPHQVQPCQFPSRELFDLVKRPPVEQGETLEHAANEFGRCLRNGLAALAAE